MCFTVCRVPLCDINVHYLSHWELDMEGERVHTHNCAPPRFPYQKHTVKERGRGGKMIVSLFMFGWTADEQTRKKKTTGVRRQSASRIKKRAHAHTPRSRGQRPITDRHSMLSQTQNVQCIRPNIPMKKNKNKHTPLHSTLKDQSRPSPRIQDHTSCCYGRKAGLGRWGRRKGWGRMTCTEG